MIKKRSLIELMIFGTFMIAMLFGCATPQTSRSGRLMPDQEDQMGGHFLESSDIRTIASQMGAEILSVPEIAGNPDPTYIAISPVRNSTRYLIDKDILMKRLRIELGRYSAGKVRFISQTLGQNVRKQIVKADDEAAWESAVANIADSLAAAPFTRNLKSRVTVAVLPPRNVNLVDINAESFLAFLRAEAANKVSDKMSFIIVPKTAEQTENTTSNTAPSAFVGGKNINITTLNIENNSQIGDPVPPKAEELPKADYYLTGEFIAKSIVEESLAAKAVSRTQRNPDDPSITEFTTNKIREKPNVGKYLNVILAKSGTNTSVFEKMVKLESKMKSGLGRTSLLLTGELSALSKAGAGGDRSDYVIMSFQLVEPKSNVILWENAYETKRTSTKSIIYK